MPRGIPNPKTPLVPVRKKLAGSDSNGNTWAEDGAVVRVPYEQAMELIAIPDGGFTVADQDDTPAAEVTEPAPAAKKAITEPAPAAKAPAAESGSK